MKFGKKTLVVVMLLSCVFNGKILAEEKSGVRTIESIRVSNKQELLEAIDSNRRIILRNGVYDFRRKEKLDGTMEEKSNIEIKNLENISIQGGIGVKILMDQGDMFLNIQESNNIQVKDIVVEYRESERSKIESAVIINESEEVTLDNVEIYRSSGDAIIISNSKDIRGNKINIQGCTEGIMKIYNSLWISFQDSTLKSNKSEYGLTIAWSENILFQDCLFENNISRENELINISRDEFAESSKVVEFKDTKFINNTREN